MIFTHYKYHLLLFVCLLVAFFTLWNGTNGPLVLDDFYNLAPLLNEENPDYSNIILSNESGPLGRSVSMATFVINHWIRGGVSVFELKLTNLFLHLNNALLLYLLLIILLNECRLRNQRHLLALAITLCWVLSPVNSSVLYYAVQRMAMLSTFFILIGCLIYLYMRPLLFRGPQKIIFICSLLFICWVLATLSKENGILFPAFIISIELCFFNDLRLWIKNVTKNKIIVYVCVLFVFFSLMIGLVNHKGYLDYSKTDFDLAARLFTQPVVIVDYIYGLFMPFNMDISLYTDDVSVQTTFWNLKTTASGLVLFFMLLICAYSIPGNKFRYLSFGLLFFLIGHLIESTIFPLEIYFNHRNYLPSIGIYYFLCLFLYQCFYRIGMSRLFIPVFVIYLSLFMFFSYEKSKVWSSEEKIIANAVYYHPLSVRANMTMVELLRRKGKVDQALEMNNQIIESKTDDVFRSIIQRLYLYCWAGLTLPKHEYARFSKNIDRSHGRETANALQNLLDISKINNCDGINIIEFVRDLSGWIDEKIQLNFYTSEQLWHLEYYVIEFMLAFDQKEFAVQRLKRFAELGNIAAIQYYEDNFKQ